MITKTDARLTGGQTTTTPTLSILTPAIPERIEQLATLRGLIEPQQAQLPAGSVEWLVFCDTRGARTVGEKRDELLRMARGDYVAFVDDDDRVSNDYCEAILKAIQAYPAADVITFRQHVTYNGETGEVCFRLGAPNQPFAPGCETLRAPWHACAFRSQLAKAHHFPASNYGEDWAWARHVGADCKTEAHVPLILHFYRHDITTTAAPPPNANH
jgi:hypothetical protein